MTELTPDDIPHPYAGSKRAAELAIEAQAARGNLSAVTLRLMNIAGGNDPDPTRIIPRALDAAMGGKPLEINGDGSAVRDFVHIADAADAFVAALDCVPVAGSSVRYNVGSGRRTSITDVVRTVGPHRRKAGR